MSAGALVPAEMKTVIPYRTLNEMEQAFEKDEAFRQRMQGLFQSYAMLNLINADYQMRDTSQTSPLAGRVWTILEVGNVFKLAYAGSMGLDCSKAIHKNFDAFVDMLGLALTETNKSVIRIESILRAFPPVVSALEKQKATSAKKRLENIVATAGEILSGIEKTLDQCQQMKEQLQVTFEETQSAALESKKLSVEAEKQIARLDAISARAKSEATSLEEKLKNLAIEEAIASAIALLADVGPGKVFFDLDTSLGKAKGNFSIEQMRSEPASIIEALDAFRAELAEEVKDLREKITEKKSLSGSDEDREGLQKEVEALSEELAAKEQKIEQVIDRRYKLTEKARDRHSDVVRLRRETENTLQKAKADFAEMAVSLKHAQIAKDDLAQALISLNVAEAAISRVQAVLKNYKLFWEELQTRTQMITQSTDESIAEIGEEDLTELIQKIHNTAEEWMAAGLVSFAARDALKAVFENANHAFGNLPLTSDLGQRFIEDEIKRAQGETLAIEEPQDPQEE